MQTDEAAVVSQFTPDALFKALLEAGVQQPKGISMKTNISAFLSFMTIDEAVAAHTSFIDGSTSIESVPGPG